MAFLVKLLDVFLLSRLKWHFFSFFLSFYLFIFREKKGGRKRGRETSMCGCLSHAPYCANQACNPGMSPDWESNWQPFDLQVDTQSTEPHQPGLKWHFLMCVFDAPFRKEKLLKWMRQQQLSWRIHNLLKIFWSDQLERSCRHMEAVSALWSKVWLSVSYSQGSIWISIMLVSDNQSNKWVITLLFLNLHPRVCTLIFYFYFLERGKGGETEGEKHWYERETLIGWLPTRDQTNNLGMCPHWELSPWHFGLQPLLQPTEPRQPGLT